MPIPIDIIEDFFGTKFNITSDLSSPELRIGEFLHFDGYAHWGVLWLEKEDLLWIRVGVSETSDKSQYSAGSIFEVGIYCSDATLTEAIGIGPVLLLHPKDDTRPESVVWMVKHSTGKLSLELAVGGRSTTST